MHRIDRSKPSGSSGRATATSKKARPAATAQVAAGVDVAALRNALGVTRPVFHRLTGFSERALANWEAGKRTPDRSVQRRIRELGRLHAALSRIIRPSYLAEWFDAPNEAFGGLKPLEVIERGEMDRLWQMVYELESGAAT